MGKAKDEKTYADLCAEPDSHIMSNIFVFLRIKLKVTQEEIAFHAGMTVTELKELEGRADIEIALPEIARYLTILLIEADCKEENNANQ